MRKFEAQNSYKKDLKLVIKQGWDKDKIQSVIEQLLNDDVLSPALRDHALQGDLQNFRECHIFGDLVIIYQRNDENLILYRIGRHQDLFKNY